MCFALRGAVACVVVVVGGVCCEQVFLVVCEWSKGDWCGRLVGLGGGLDVCFVLFCWVVWVRRRCCCGVDERRILPGLIHSQRELGCGCVMV